MFTFGKAESSAILASAADFGLTIFLVRALEVWYARASFFGALMGGIVNCYVNYRWVFDKQKQRKPFIALKYHFVWSFSILFNTAGTWLFTVLSGMNFIIVKAVVAIIVAILWNFQMQRVFVFRNLHAHYKE